MSFIAILLELSVEEEKLVKEYAEANNITASALLREAVLEKIEDDIDLENYHKAMAEHLKEDTSLSYDKMIDELETEL